MKLGMKTILYILYILVGITLIILGLTGILDAFWSGMGSGLLVVSALQIIRLVRLYKNSDYREKLETEVSDERNRFLRNKAWAWAGYLFVLTAAVGSIVLRILGQELLSSAAAWAVCLITLLYWISFMILRRKY